MSRAEMVLKETMHKSKVFYDKTLQNLKSFFCGGYKKLPKSLSLNPCFCGSDLKYYPRDEFYTDYYDEWESTIDEVKKRDSTSKETIKDEDPCSDSFMMFPKQSPKKNKQEGGLLRDKKSSGGSRDLGKGKDQLSFQNMNGNRGSNVLAKRMKEFEMVDAGDVEQVLDVEEALHYYSRLKSPVYLDIVDKFFLDMYSDFSAPPAPSISINNSKQRVGSRRLGSRRLGSIRL
ncbi:uncharacterized protein LOC133725215 [Rosa rugosa]|uniref:uncharacterized protein LOC133725215 n=1 Tax=Rosa rugosa TaxID=74645 RepID=UPI002B402159|nr:uncharacterized protein LOC133725215 [Rosa rugosa]XP_062008354.1 uncharacterized protein LOC133725215 [Rosa rugosa]